MLLAVAGCGSSASTSLDRIALQGKVTVDGVSAGKGSLTLRPDDATGGPLIRTAVNDGVYSFNRTTGPIVGSYTAVFEPEAPAQAGTPGRGSRSASKFSGMDGGATEAPKGSAGPAVEGGAVPVVISKDMTALDIEI